MGVEFVDFPEVLHVHLQRFEYNSPSGRLSKISDTLPFPAELDLSNLLTESRRGSPAQFSLF
jgi:hypothetical protein